MVNKNPNKYGYLLNPTTPIANGSPGWITRPDVGVTYFSDPGPGENRRGNLDADFGDTGGQGRIGPEYGFGLVVGSQLGDNVLIIKYAFGGRSLAVDFRPPSAVAARGGAIGPYYTGMLLRINQVIADLPTYYPAYQLADKYEIVGFGWHQGFNDRINASFTAEYEANMTNLIKDLRTDLQVPNLPVVIGDTGMSNAPTGVGSLVAAQANVADPSRHPEFTGNVITVKTTRFDYGTLLGGSTEGYHWNWNAESYFNIGESMGLAMMSLLPALNSDKEISNFIFPGLPAASIAGSNISVTVPFGTDVTALAPTFTLSSLATVLPASGTQRNFSTSQTYTVTAQDLSTQIYTVSVTVAPSPYRTWASTLALGLTAGENDAPLNDPDLDGISNLMEFVLGGRPLASSQSILPTLAKEPSGWVFEYNRSDLSLLPATTQIVEYGGDLVGWTQVVIPATSDGIVEITPGSPADRVKVTIPNQGSKAFVRLKVSQ
jgi:alpha-galactosidase